MMISEIFAFDIIEQLRQVRFYRLKLINKLMKRLKATKKKLSTVNTQLDHSSREIILSIFTQQSQNDRLEYTRSRWKTTKKQDRRKLSQKLDSAVQQPDKTILPMLQYIAKGVDIEISSFFIVQGSFLHVIYKQKEIKFVKTKFQARKLKYWLSHLYFSKLKEKLMNDLIQKKENTSRQIVHVFQEMQYMPKILNGSTNKTSPLIRKLKISPESCYRRKGQTEKKPFCILYCKNGMQQTLSFSEVVAFADYSFNMADILYIRILCPVPKDGGSFLINYTKSKEKQNQMLIIQKFKDIFNRIEGWQSIKHGIQELKMQQMNNNKFEQYVKIITLEMVAYIQIRHFLMIKNIETEWILDQNNNLNLTNVWSFNTVQINQIKNGDGLATLYSKFKNETTDMTPHRTMKRDSSSRYNRFKSEQKQSKNMGWLPLPLVSVSKPLRREKIFEQKSGRLLRHKGKSCVIRSGFALSD